MISSRQFFWYRKAKKMEQAAREAHEVDNVISMRPLKKRCRILAAGSLGISPSFKKASQDWGIRGLIVKLFERSLNGDT